MILKIKKSKFLDYTTPINVLLIIFGFVFVFASQDPNLSDQSELTQQFYELFMQGFGHKHFSFLQFLIVLISLIIIHKHWRKNKITSYKKEKMIFILTIIYLIFLMINPNNRSQTPIFGLPLFSDLPFIVSLLFMCALFFVKNEVDFIKIFRNLVKIIVFFFVVRVFFLIFLWFLGKGVYYFGVQSVTMEEDTLLLAVLVGVIFLIMFYISEKKKFLFLWLVFQVFQVLSFRRSGVLLSFLISGFFLFLFYSRGNNLKRIFSYSFITLSIVVLSFNLNVLPNSALLYLNRYIGEFISLPGSSYIYADIAKNVHIDQSNKSILELATGLPFWGFGYGESSTRLNYNYKGNTGIHNVYFNLWEWQGLFSLIYYLILISFFVNEVVITIRNYKSYDKAYLYLRSGIMIFFAFYLINAYVLMMVNFTGLKMRILWVLIFAFLLKVKPNNYKHIISL